MFEDKAVLESLKNKNTQQTSSMIMSYSNNVVYFDLLPCPSWCLTCNKHWICNHRVNGWISCNRMWESLSMCSWYLWDCQKACLGVEKEIENDANMKEQANTARWAVEINEGKTGPFSPRSFSGTDQLYFIDFRCSLSCVFLCFGCALFSIFSASLLCFILHCGCSEVGFDGRVLAQ